MPCKWRHATATPSGGCCACTHGRFSACTHGRYSVPRVCSVPRVIFCTHGKYSVPRVYCCACTHGKYPACTHGTLCLGLEAQVLDGTAYLSRPYQPMAIHKLPVVSTQRSMGACVVLACEGEETAICPSMVVAEYSTAGAVKMVLLISGGQHKPPNPAPIALSGA